MAYFNSNFSRLVQLLCASCGEVMGDVVHPPGRPPRLGERGDGMGGNVRYST